MSKAKDKADRLAQMDAAPIVHNDPIGALAARGENRKLTDVVEFKVRLPFGLLQELDKIASENRYARNGVAVMFLEVGLAEYKARRKAKLLGRKP